MREMTAFILYHFDKSGKAVYLDWVGRRDVAKREIEEPDKMKWWGDWWEEAGYPEDVRIFETTVLYKRHSEIGDKCKRILEAAAN